MKKFLLSIVILVAAAATMQAQQTYSITGTVLNKTDGKPVEYATVVLETTEQWAVADKNGNFTITNIQPGKNVISISCLGFVTDTREIVINRDIDTYLIYLPEDNLTLESVVVTAQDNSNSATTSRTIDKTALDHIQLMNVADASSLLPGGGDE